MKKRILNNFLPAGNTKGAESLFSKRAIVKTTHESQTRFTNPEHDYEHDGIPPSHMFDNIVTKRAAFDLGRSVHQAREIIGDAFAGDGAI